MTTSTEASLRLPDGRPFELWEDRTDYTRVLYVDQAHPEASDDNLGTEARPFMTINRAAQDLGPGEKVIVKSGVYRERISPARGGLGPDDMIKYEAAAGHSVVVRGSRVVPSEWERSTDPEGEDYSFRLWQIALAGALFPYKARPFATPNASNEEIDLMPWALRWKDRIPYTLPRGLVFQDGRRMVQLATYEDLVRLPGSYWVDPNYCIIHVHPYDRVNPNEATFEVTVQEHLFKPERKGLGYICVQGFVFEHAGNGFPRVGVGAVCVNGGHHWIIEGSVVRHCNSVGIEAGARVDEAAAATAEENARVAAHEGGFVIRGNDVYDCGTGGIEGHTVRDTLIENNTLHQIGWQDVERYWECAAIKTLINHDTVVRRNLIYNVESASAVWLDWDNRNCRITRNVIYDIRDTHNGAVFIEASRYPNLIDHNIIWETWRSAVTLFDTDKTEVCHNLIAHSAIPVLSKVNTDRSLHGRPMTSRDNVFVNNILYGNDAPPIFEDPENVVDYNVDAEGDAATTEETIGGEHDATIPMRLNFNAEILTLAFELKQRLPAVPARPCSEADFFDKPTTGPAGGETVRPGPFDSIFAGRVVFNLYEEKTESEDKAS